MLAAEFYPVELMAGQRWVVEVVQLAEGSPREVAEVVGAV